jgi:hypothetical protein
MIGALIKMKRIESSYERRERKSNKGCNEAREIKMM